VLAVASAFAQSESPLQGLYTTLGAAVYIGIMVLLLRPLLARAHLCMAKKGAVESPYYETCIFLLLIASAFTTEALGIHAFFGSFMMGLCVPKVGGFAEGLASRMELVVSE
jgi:Kef-type K+ transport system membrane component KefB